MRIAGTVSGLIFLTLCFVSNCLACDCVTLPAEESFQRADSVFMGEMIHMNQSSTPITYTFRVDKSLKGNEAQEVIVSSRNSNCDFAFNLGTSYLVYARRFEDKLISGACSGTTSLGISARGAQSLLSSQDSASLPAFRLVVTVAGVVVLLALFVWWLAKKRMQRAA